jgi:hypothetical protein
MTRLSLGERGQHGPSFSSGISPNRPTNGPGEVAADDETRAVTEVSERIRRPTPAVLTAVTARPN